jgi:hypothetical protein
VPNESHDPEEPVPVDQPHDRRTYDMHDTHEGISCQRHCVRVARQRVACLMYMTSCG